MNEDEIWKPIPGFTGYDISDQGRVRSYYMRGGGNRWCISEEPQRILRPLNNRYLKVNLISDSGLPTMMNIHQVVALVFIGEPPEGMEVCHNDGNKHNNRIDNLRYDTHTNNMIDAVHAGKMHRSVSPRIVHAIRQSYNNAFSSIKDLAERFSISEGHVRQIVTGRARIHEGGPITPGTTWSKLHPDKVVEIRKRASKEMQKDLAKEFGVSESMISRIVNGNRR